jgi:hypothetical protein
MIDFTGAVRQQVVVATDPQHAFELFTGHMIDWWPSQHHIGNAPLESIVLEPRAGGRWYNRHQDGTEIATGFVQVWEPPSRVVVTWQITASWSYDTTLITTLDVTFTAHGDEQTLVELIHDGLDNYGPDTDRMRALYDEPDAWAGILQGFAGWAEASA